MTPFKGLSYFFVLGLFAFTTSATNAQDRICRTNALSGIFSMARNLSAVDSFQIRMTPRFAESTETIRTEDDLFQMIAKIPRVPGVVSSGFSDMIGENQTR